MRMGWGGWGLSGDNQTTVSHSKLTMTIEASQTSGALLQSRMPSVKPPLACCCPVQLHALTSTCRRSFAALKKNGTDLSSGCYTLVHAFQKSYQSLTTLRSIPASVLDMPDKGVQGK